MRLIWNLSAVLLSAAAAVAQAQPPYAIHGLHTDLVFTEALAQAEKLGGKCQVSLSRSQEGGTNAECEFASCNARDTAGECEPESGELAGLTIAEQPIMRLGLDAPGESAQLTRVVFLYEGSQKVVAAYLEKVFGAPNGEAHRPDEQSWSHSRRLVWTQGIYRVGLLDNPKLLILGADRTQK